VKLSAFVTTARTIFSANKINTKENLVNCKENQSKRLPIFGGGFGSVTSRISSLRMMAFLYFGLASVWSDQIPKSSSSPKLTSLSIYLFCPKEERTLEDKRKKKRREREREKSVPSISI
jgi:hypothetical protein